MENNQRNSKKRLNSLILLVAFTAVMLIVSTYAWFSTQKNVTISGLTGVVKVAEGLQISLDALNWKNEIDLSTDGITEYFKATNQALSTNYDLKNPHTGRYNAIPSELKPASTTGQAASGEGSNAVAADGIGINRLNMYTGVNTDAVKLTNIKLLAEDGTKADLDQNGSNSGYFAIDLYLQNASSTAAVTAGTPDKILLEPNSAITLKTASKQSTGLQNTLRTAFALFDNAGGETGDDDVLVDKLPSQSQIIGASADQTIKDVAIWEPNASGANIVDEDDDTTILTWAAHVPYVVQNNNKITWSIADAQSVFSRTVTEPTQIGFEAGTAIPTYALTAKSATATEVTGATDGGSLANIYDWATPATGLTKQVTNQTTNAGIGNDPIQLKSIKGTDFAIEPGEYCKVRLYVWLEGQDVDCINYASLGGDLNIEVGISKPGTTGSGT